MKYYCSENIDLFKIVCYKKWNKEELSRYNE